MNTRRAALTGAALVALYTGAIAAADGITKLIAGGLSGKQTYAKGLRHPPPRPCPGGEQAR